MISKVVEMDKKYNDSSIQWLMVKKSFDFAIYYLVALYYDLDLVLNEVASNDLEVASFWRILPPECERACGGPEFSDIKSSVPAYNFPSTVIWKTTYSRTFLWQTFYMQSFWKEPVKLGTRLIVLKI